MSYEEIECPYCEHAYDLIHDDGAFYNDGGREEEQCPKCDKKFMVLLSISWDFSAEECECLNTGEHKWELKYPEYVLKNHPLLASRQMCADCGENRIV